MAISKVIYKTSAQDTGTVWMDATSATAAAADITAPKTAMLADGVVTTGTGSGGGGGLEYETGTYTPASDIARPTISFSKTHGTTPIYVAMFDVSAATGLTANSNTAFTFSDVYRLFNAGYPYTETGTTRYAVVIFRYSSGTSQGGNIVQQEYNSDNTGDSSNNYPRYYINESEFKPYSNSNTRYWRAGRTYKWIAVWGSTT